MDQLILFHKPNKKLESEMVMDHIIPPTKHPRSVLYDEGPRKWDCGSAYGRCSDFSVVGFLPIFSHLDQLRLHS